MDRRNFLTGAAVAPLTLAAAKAEAARRDMVIVERPIMLTGDPDLHHVNDGRGRTRKVFLDGVEQQNVMKAHTRDGWVEVIYKENGKFVAGEDGNIITEVRWGNVTVEWGPEEW